MAFTSAQRAKIRFYCGYPLFAVGSTRLESAIDAVGADSALQAEAETTLAALAAVEAEISSTLAHVEFEKAEEVALNPTRDRDLRVRGRREVRRLCAQLNLSGPLLDVFASGWSGGEMGWAG